MGILVLGCAFSLSLASAEEPSAALLDEYNACAQGCLYAVARLKGVQTGIAYVKKLVGPPQRGQHSLATIERAAHDLGLFPIAVSVDQSELRGLPMPAICHLKHSFFLHGQGPHFIVLLAARDNGVVILDLPFRTAFVPWTAFRAEWTGNLLLFADSADAARKWKGSFESPADHRLKGRLVFSGSLLLFVALITIQWEGCKVVIRGAVRAARALSPSARGVAGSERPSRRRCAIRTASRVLPVLVAGVVTVVLGRCLMHPEKGAMLRTPSGVVDLGEFPPGEGKTTIRLRNVGDRSLRIERVMTTCACALPATPPDIAPGGEANLDLSLAVTPGPRSAHVVVCSNDPEGPHEFALRWYGSAMPQFLPPRVFAQGVPLGSKYERTIQIVYAGGPFAIVPRVVNIECDGPGVTMRVGKNERNAFRTAKTVRDSKTSVGYLGLALEIDSPMEPIEIDCLCRITIEYGKSTYVLSLPVRVSFVGKVRAAVNSMVFAGTQTRAIVGKERRIKLAIDPSIAASTPHVKECPPWLTCTLDRESATEYVLHAKVRDVPRDLCEKGRIVIAAGQSASSEATLGVFTFTLGD